MCAVHFEFVRTQRFRTNVTWRCDLVTDGAHFIASLRISPHRAAKSFTMLYNLSHYFIIIILNMFSICNMLTLSLHITHIDGEKIVKTLYREIVNNWS